MWYEHGSHSRLINLSQVVSISIHKRDAKMLRIEDIGNGVSYLEFEDERDCTEAYQIIRWKVLNGPEPPQQAITLGSFPFIVGED
jgi:hypothetical protein